MKSKIKEGNMDGLAVISKPQVALKNKAQSDEKAQSSGKRDEHFEEGCNTGIRR